MLKELRIAGFGGQGVILCANILGRATALYEDAFATMVQSFGPEARGGAASAQLILSSDPILYPYVGKLDILVVMSQEAYTRFVPDLKQDGILLVEEDLVRMDTTSRPRRTFSIPATRLAEQIGKKMVLNVVMVGFLCAITKAVSHEAARKAVGDLVPAKVREMNLQAFEKGYEYGCNQLNGEPRHEDVEAALLQLESME